MAQEIAPDQVEATPKKKSRKKLLVLLILVFVLAGGGVGGFFFWRQRSNATSAKAAAAKEHGDEKQGHGAESTEEGEVAEVVELQPFIVNLADPNDARYLRMTITLGIGDGGEHKPDPLFTTKVRNAILAIITTKTSEQILTVEGKAELRKEMLNAARKAVHEPAVQAIYITDFIVQM